MSGSPPLLPPRGNKANRGGEDGDPGDNVYGRMKRALRIFTTKDFENLNR